MAEQSSIFPPPPPFYKDFTAANVQRLQEFKDTQTTGDNAAATSSSILDLPPELRLLVPPEPPTDGKFRFFGANIDVCPFPSLLSIARLTHHDQIHDRLPTLADFEPPIPQLYPTIPASSGDATHSTDLAAYLRTTLRTILLTFLQLTSILSQNPAGHAQKVKQLETLVFNAHQLINEYRPHQARETLIRMMEEQVEARKQEIEGVDAMREKVRGLLGDLETEVGLSGKGALGIGAGAGGVSGSEDRDGEGEELGRWKGEQRAIWAAMDEELAA